MQSKAATVKEYLAQLPADRRAAIEAVRKIFLDNLDKGYQEAMQYGMIGYSVPHTIYPDGYHCDPRQPLPFGGIASQKGHMSLYLFCLYVQSGRSELISWFQTEWARTGKKLDMGKSCIRFKKLDDLALDVIAEAIRRMSVKSFIDHYQAAISGRQKPVTQKPSKPVAKKPSAAKPTAPAASKKKKTSKTPRKKSSSRAG